MFGAFAPRYWPGAGRADWPGRERYDVRSANWDDLRFVLAVIDEGSLARAARTLGVNHATVLRRITAFEAASQMQIFDKTAQGYRVAPDRAQVIEAIQSVERAVQHVERLLAGARLPVGGEVRITSTDSFCQIILPPILARISQQMPGLVTTVVSSNTHLDLGRIEADITVRPTGRLPAELTEESPARLRFAAYCDARGADPDTLPCLGLKGTLARTVPARWLEANIGPEAMGDGADSFLTLARMAAEGRGIALLPTYLGAAEAGLARLWGRTPELAVDLWVASHVDLAPVPRFARLRRLLCDEIAAVFARIDAG